MLCISNKIVRCISNLVQLMKTIISALIPTLLFVISAAQARIGETRDECIKRYGKIILQEKDPVLGEMLTFEKGDVVISTMIQADKCVGMMYTKEKKYTEQELVKKYGAGNIDKLSEEQKIKPLAFTLAERFKLMEINSGNKEWGPMTEETLKLFLPDHMAKAVVSNPEAMEQYKESRFYREGDGGGYFAMLGTASDIEGMEGQNAVCEIFFIRADLFALMGRAEGQLDKAVDDTLEGF